MINLWNSSMSGIKLLPVGVAVLVALFPFGWLAQVWPAFGDLVDFVFGSDVAHIAGHFGIFVLVGTAVLLLFPRLLAHPLIYLGLVLFLGGLQEFMQLASFKRHPVTADELFDMEIDLLGAVFAFLICKKVGRIDN